MTAINVRWYLFNLETKRLSKKSWKTYKGAERNAGRVDMITSLEGVDWFLRHPEWCQQRIEACKK